MNSALRGEMAVGLVFLLILVKMFATSVTLASGGSGGIFAPSLFMGAMTGSVVGHAANRLLPEITASPGAYALVGMGALVGAATHAPITAIVMIFEMTNDYKIILPLMISTIVGVLTSNYLHRESIYTHKLKRKGVILEKGMESNLLKSIKVQDVMRRGFESVPHDLPFNFLIDVLLQTARSRVAVVDDDGGLVGVIPREMAQKFLSEKDLLSELIIARDLVVPDPSLLYPEDTLELASLRFQEYDCRELFVVDGEQTRRLVGMVRKGDLMDAYQREMIKLESGATFAYNINRRHRMEPVNVMDGYGILEVEAPHEFSGKRLRDLDLRNRFGINVLAIKRSGGVGRNGARMWVPESSDALEDGDVLVVLGETEVINNLRSRW
jgi:CIC family chloride channel protein